MELGERSPGDVAVVDDEEAAPPEDNFLLGDYRVPDDEKGNETDDSDPLVDLAKVFV